jgi:hypothetical protein
MQLLGNRHGSTSNISASTTPAGINSGDRQPLQQVGQADVGTVLQALQAAQVRVEATLAEVSSRQAEAEAKLREERKRLETILSEVLQTIKGGGQGNALSLQQG